jgi:Protein of unknown function (DUF2490)
MIPKPQRKFLILLLCLIGTVARSQSNQIWTDYTFNAPFANSYLFTTQLSYRTQIGSNDKWRELEINPTIERVLHFRWDVLASFLGSATHQQDAYNTNELRAAIGIRYHITPHTPVQLRALIRLEDRNLYHQESGTWASSTRSRFRIESLIPINQKSMFEDQLWYGILDAEVFWVMDQQLGERYSNQMRYRAGVGYRHSHTWRFEFVYTDQFSRNNLESNFQEVANIFRFRVKHFINKAKPVKQEPANE